MANINYNGKFIPFGTDLQKLLLVKCRTEKKCNSCSNIIPSGSVCMGKSCCSGWWYTRVCLNCANNFLNNFIESIDKFKQIAKDTLKDIKKNEKEHKAINSLAKI